MSFRILNQKINILLQIERKDITQYGKTFCTVRIYCTFKKLIHLPKLNQPI